MRGGPKGAGWVYKYFLQDLLYLFKFLEDSLTFFKGLQCDFVFYEVICVCLYVHVELTLTPWHLHYSEIIQMWRQTDYTGWFSSFPSWPFSVNWNLWSAGCFCVSFWPTVPRVFDISRFQSVTPSLLHKYNCNSGSCRVIKPGWQRVTA